ncbi:MAG: hypothetical protein CMJ83_18865 [Planctomycetes bacterium]|nr:hypothetical protein [Planctomycetota bacterium]
MRQAMLITVVLLGCAALNATAQSKQKSPSLVKASVRTAVPGIDALFVLDEERTAKPVELSKATLRTEDLKAARKTARDKSADRRSKRAARKKVAEARSEFSKKAVALLSKDQQMLVSKIYKSADETQKKVQAEFKPRLDAAKGDRKAQRKIRKEMRAASKAKSRAAVLALLSEEQRKTVEAAAKKNAKDQKKPNEKKGRKEGNGKA